MDDLRKNAYRYLLYKAMIDIRMLCQSRGRESYNPLEWRRQYSSSRTAGALADWLHNLAFYAGRDFQGFDEGQFWSEYDSIDRRNSTFTAGGLDYRRHFEEGMTWFQGNESL